MPKINKLSATGYQTFAEESVEVTPELRRRFRDEVRRHIPSANISDYRLVGDGWAHRSATLFGSPRIGAGAVIRAGTMLGVGASVIPGAITPRGVVSSGTTVM